MKPRDGKQHVFFQILPVLFLLLVMSGTSADAEGLRLTPDSIRIGPFFNGSLVHVSGEIPAKSRAVVEIIGKRIEEQLLRKGRRWDIWMSVGEIDIEDAPCLLRTEHRPDRILRYKSGPGVRLRSPEKAGLFRGGRTGNDAHRNLSPVY